MSRPLAGKFALVTGGSRGIGRAISQALARDGAAVAVHYGRNSDAAERTVHAIRSSGGDAFVVNADLAGKGAVAALFEALDTELVRRSGTNRFDILVNNAAIGPFVALLETPEETLDELYAVNVKAPFLASVEASRRLNDGGRIVNLSTVVTRLPLPAVAAYSALKAPLDNFTKSFAAELGGRGITVNAVAPGVIDTDMAAAFARTKEGAAFALGKQALKRLGKPDDVADAVAFLAGPGGRWITGQVIEVSGGSAITY